MTAEVVGGEWWGGERESDLVVGLGDERPRTVEWRTGRLGTVDWMTEVLKHVTGTLKTVGWKTGIDWMIEILKGVNGGPRYVDWEI